MMELRSRSRSTTPLQTQSLIEAETFAGNNHVSVTRTTRRTTTVKAVASGGPTSRESATDATSARNKSTKSARAFVKTSDYSSDDGEFENLHPRISENEKNQIIEDAKAAANGKAEISALKLYRQAGRYWDIYPKTDYTYSRHSRDRVEIAPGVVQMPNMSRRTIHSDSATNTDAYYGTSKSHLVQQRLFASANNNDEVDESFRIYRSSARRRRTVVAVAASIFTRIYSAVFWLLYAAYRASNTTMIFFGKKLHHVASRVMLLDTWLLKRSTTAKRTKGVLALCLLPLLVFAAWFLLSSLGSAIYWSVFNPSTVPAPLLKEETIVDSFDGQLNSELIIERILQDPKIYNIVNKYHNDVKIREESEERLHQIIDELKSEIKKVKSDLISLERTKNADMNRILSQIRSENFRNMARLSQRLGRCCDKQMIDLEPYITKVFGSLLDSPEFLSNQRGLVEWLHALFATREHLEGRLTNLTRHLSKDFESSVKNTADRVMERVVTKLSDRLFDSGSITEERINAAVRSALKIYDADRTGLVDYAMEPLGGEIVTTRCTESYHSGTAVISVLGIPVWSPSISPRTVITPGINPGECWAFQNFPGFLVIKLANRVEIEAFSLEHVSRLLVPEGRTDSAPKEFAVYGLTDENDKDPVKIGEYVYDYDGDALQFFVAQREGSLFSMVEVRIKSNHGNPNYTCLYRFRVHGKVSNEPT